MKAALLFWLLVPVALASADGPTVNTNYGPVKGFEFETVDGKKANIFLGIPFAKPPVGELRLEKPEKPEKWSEPLEAVKFSPACFPHHRSCLFNPDTSEDCLYLNVMAPTQKVDGGYAVMVWIHGGGYNLGSALMTPYEASANNFVTRGLILVTIQYRLGPLGFMSSGDRVLPGNLGLWDQTAALEFVKENIEHFGGDPTRIVIFGDSAGSGSTSSLTLSPYSRELFNGSVQMSGSAFAEWNTGGSVVKNSRQLAEELGCSTKDSAQMKKCLKGKTVEQFLDAFDKTGKFSGNMKIIKYGPRLDSEFFPSDLKTLVEEAPKKPSIIGLTEKEGILFSLTPYATTLTAINISPEDFKKYRRDNLVEWIKKATATKEDLGDHAEEVQAKLIGFYANEHEADESDYKHWLKKYTQLLSDIAFNMPVLKETELKVQNDWPIWLYVIDYINPAVYPENFPDTGATHGAEFRYLFGEFFLFDKKIYDENEAKLQKAILDTLANFAKQGDPSTEDVKWARATRETPRYNLRLRPDPVMENTMFEKSYRFWKTLDNYDYNIYTGEVRVKASEKAKTEL